MFRWSQVCLSHRLHSCSQIKKSWLAGLISVICEYKLVERIEELRFLKLKGSVYACTCKGTMAWANYLVSARKLIFLKNPCLFFTIDQQGEKKMSCFYPQRSFFSGFRS